LDYTPPSHQNLQLESQLKYFINDLGESKSDDTILTLGTSYKLNEAITFRFAWSHDFNLMWGREDDVFTMQVYYYSE